MIAPETVILESGRTIQVRWPLDYERKAVRRLHPADAAVLLAAKATDTNPDVIAGLREVDRMAIAAAMDRLASEYAAIPRRLRRTAEARILKSAKSRKHNGRA